MDESSSPDAPRGRPFERGKSGNPAGRPQGARNRATLAAEALLDGEAEALTRKAVELALGGDMNAIRLCLDRVISPRREQPVEFELRELTTIHSGYQAMADVIAAVAAGKITLSQAAELGKLVDMYTRACEASERESREAIRALNEEEDRREAKDLRRRMGGFAGVSITR
jgi:hypothetical protein